MPGTWKLKRKKEEETPKAKHKEMHRTKSTKGSKDGHHQVTCPRRTATISGGAPARVNSTESNDSTTSPDHFYSEGRQAKKRPTLSCVFDNSNDDSDTSNASPFSSNAFKIYFEDDTTSFETVGVAQEGVPLINVLEAAFYEQKKDCTRISDYMIISQDDATGDSCVADVHSPSTDYLGTTIQIVLSQNNFVENEIESPLSEVVTMTVQTCLDYFDTHGIIKLPSNKCYDDIYRPPIVDEPIDPIESSWDELPIEEDIKNSLNSTQMSCQQAIWELIVTEHSFLKQLEIIINIYMRSLEFIRRQGLLTDVNYHNIFGYMEDIYKVHEQLWSCTLYPCLEKVRMEHCPLDVNDIILRFPSQFSDDFDIYEQHCAFETTNLNSLDEAMNDADFRAYVKWCESQPECNRLRLKDFLAIPRQRLMKYQLLFQAILKKTPQHANTEELKHIIEDVSLFVDTVNGALKTQDETTRVQEVMKKIVGYAPVEIPGDFKEFVQPHTHLDLMAPMPDVDVTKIRLLVLEGKLRFRDQKDKMVAHVFLFSDMLLITKPNKGKVENYTIIRPPYKISNIQVELKGDAVCCIVLNEFKVLSALFTLKANSAHIAKGWRDQIISTQDFYDSALTRTIPTIHILQSLRQERTLHGVSQDFSLDPPDSRLGASPLLSAGTGFHRVNSNDSTLSSNSSNAFPFDGQILSPRPGRRDTVPCHGFTESKRSFRRNSANPCPSPHSLSTSLSFGIAPPMWQRTSSLNALPERKMSDFGHKASRSHLKLRQSNSVSDYNDVQRSNSDPQRADSFGELTQSKASKQNDFADDCPMLVEKAAPLQESDSNTDDEEYSSSTSPINPPAWSTNLDTTGITTRRHRRNKSQPNSMYVIDTSTPDLSRHDERDESMYTVPVNGATGTEGKQPTDDSLMGEIIKELSKTDSGNSKKLQHDFEETYDSFDADVKAQRKRSMSLHSSIGRLERRFNNRRRAIYQLDNIFEATDETESDSKLQEMSTDSTYFARNTKLRRSKSSFELSFHRRLKPPSPLITHMQRSFEKESSDDYSHSHTKLSTHISTPILPSHQLRKEPKPVPEQAKAMKGAKQKKEKKSPEKRRYGLSFFKRDRSSSPTENKWGLKGLRRAMTMSVDTGLNRTGISPTDEPTSPATTTSTSSSSSGKKGTRRGSSKIMIVVRSDNKK